MPCVEALFKGSGKNTFFFDIVGASIDNAEGA
jgi:hypothetical protein